MTRDDYLHIFRTFWPSEGYAGIVKHLPDWSKSRASNFAFRHGIKMMPEAKTRKNHHARPVYPERTTTNNLLMGKW